MSLSDDELRRLLDAECDQSEFKESDSNLDKIRDTICAFSNDLADHRNPGVIFIGLKNDGSCAGTQIDDDLLNRISNLPYDKLVPVPFIQVETRELKNCRLALVIVHPSKSTPVRHSGKVWVRVGTTNHIATPEQERILNERRRYRDKPFDLTPVVSASIEDLDIDYFKSTYLPSAVDPHWLAANNRSVEAQLASVKFVEAEDASVPTVVGLLAMGREPADFIPGAYIEFIRFSGTEFADAVTDNQRISGSLYYALRRLDDVLRANIKTEIRFVSTDTELRYPDYPMAALQQIARNAIMHRNYETSNAPTRIYWFTDRIEIHSPGGPYGSVTIKNFGTPGITDYRNPSIAEAMKNLGYVQRFGVGISTAKRELVDNGNPEPEFIVEESHIAVIIRSNR